MQEFTMSHLSLATYAQMKIAQWKMLNPCIGGEL